MTVAALDGGLAERDQQAYRLARTYLLNLDGVTAEALDRQLTPTLGVTRQSMPIVYERLLESAQNKQMMPNVIGKAIDGLDKLRPVLCEFEPSAIVRKYGLKADQMLNDVESRLKPRGQIRRTPRGLWPQFCRSALTGAGFLSQFRTSADFYAWADFFDEDERARPALPMLLSQEVDGFAFALACDFLKELGYVNFGKPDVHLKSIFEGLGLSASRKDYEVFKAIIRVARSVGVTPYNVDKLFWLIGSGNFYLTGIKVGSQRKQFIDYAARLLDGAQAARTT